MNHVRAFQITLAVAAAVPVLGGAYEILKGTGIIDPAPAMESHYHYLNGLLLGIGLAFWSCVRDPANTARFRLLTFIVLVGGLARLFHAVTADAFEAAIIFSLAMELIVTPAMAYWQTRIARDL